jgi:uncharacterized protein
MSAPGGRIASLDALRGVAVLAITVANVPSFATVAAARSNPLVYGDLHGGNWWAWLVSYALFDGRFTAIYGMTFGASLVILADRYGRTGLPVTRLHLRRMIGLLALGLLHAYLVWYGDVLVLLAVAGTLAFRYRRLEPRRLLILGIAIMAVGSFVALDVAWQMPSWPAGKAARVQERWMPPADTIQREIAAYRAGWLGQMTHRVPTAFERQTTDLVSRSLWQMTGLMLIGMAFFKRGIFSATRSPRFYGALVAGGFGIGVPMILYGIRENFAAGWTLRHALVIDSVLNYWGGLLVGLGWVGVTMFVCQRAPRLDILAAVGRVSLTSYLLQSLLFTTIFYGHGLGLFARIDRAGQLAVALGVAAVALVNSVLWTRYFGLGPAEWAWRSLALGRRVPMRGPADLVSARAR